MGEGSRDRARLYRVLAIPFLGALLFYYYTGIGGPLLLAVVMVPYAYILNVADTLRQGRLYNRLGDRANYILAVILCTLAVVVAAYVMKEFEALISVRFGSYNRYDVIVGGIAFLLVMEYALRRHIALFALNLFLFIYTLYGRILPGPFSHPGLPLPRVLTAMSVEFETGVFERLPQLALTLIGAFIVFVSIAQGFGVINSIIRIVTSYAAKTARTIPQAAVMGSMAVATVSGSGAANAATTGSITIPLMKRIGLPPTIAAAIETASSLGGQLMPPIMGISAFVMADFLGVSYFDVVARGYVPAIIYYLGVALAVYLLAARYLPKKLALSGAGSGSTTLAKPTGLDKVNVAIFLGGIVLLIYLMGVVFMPAVYAALIASAVVLVAVTVSYYIYETRWAGSRPLEAAKGIGSSLLDSVERFSSFTADLTLLLATLGIMTGLLTITGIPTKVGFILLDIGAGNIPLLVAIGFVFGYLVGLGLPPVVTYILTAIVIAPYFIEAGINPWVVNFYAFFLGVFSELSPPTSVTAAVAAKIANASFMRTMMDALKICIPLYILMFSVFVRPELVIEPSAAQIINGVIIMIGTLSVVAALWAKTHRMLFLDAIIRAALGILGISVIFLLEGIAAYAGAAVATAALAFTVLKARSE